LNLNFLKWKRRDDVITYGKYLSKYHSAKGNFYAFIGFVIAMIIHWGPVGVGIYLIFGEGRILAGILFPILWWITLSFYFGLLPLWWIIGIFKYGFIESTLSCLLILGIFSLPDIFFWLATRQMLKADQISNWDNIEYPTKDILIANNIVEIEDQGLNQVEERKKDTKLLERDIKEPYEERLPEIICPYCKKKFIPWRKNQKFCLSFACRQKYYRDRK
jgi:hypothetical protein